MTVTEAKRAHVRIPTFRNALYERYPAFKPKPKDSMTLTEEQIAELEPLPIEKRDARLDQIAAEKHYTPQYFHSQMLKKYPQLAKRVWKLQLTDKQKAEIKHLYLDKMLTVHEIVTQLRKEGAKLQDRNVKRVLVDANVYGKNHQERLQRDYGRRRVKISYANTVSPKAEQARRDRLAATAKVPRTYLGQCADWAWKFVEEQPSLTIVDKLHEFISNRQTVLAFMEAAETHVGHKITFTEINNYLPAIPGFGSWNKRIADHFGNDPELAKAKGYMSSSYERKVEAVLKDCGALYTRCERMKINPYELDFYLPTKKLAIEASPITTHNSNTYHNYGFPDEDGKAPDYHLMKMELCRQQGVVLITLFEKSMVEPIWSTVVKPALIHRITGKLAHPLDDQQIEIKPVPKTTAKGFLNTWHVDGYSACHYAFGAFNKANGELVGVATYGIPHAAEYHSQGLLELKRLAWRSDIHSHNGISMIMDATHRQLGNQFTGVVAYSSNDFGQGEEYQNAGFKFMRELGPKLTFYNPMHPRDCYGPQIATRKSAMQGTIARRLHKMDVSAKEATRIVEESLPWRIGVGHGYVSQYDTGSKVWAQKW